MPFSTQSIVVIVTLLCHCNLASAFELATESTMSSVVIQAANSAEDLKNAATTPEGYGRGRYELMPFKSSISVALDDTDKIAEDIDYAQVQLVESQLDSSRQKTESNMLAEVVRGVLPAAVTDTIESGSEVIVERYEAFEAVALQTADVVFGQLEQSFKLVSASVNSISHEVSRYLESFSATNVGFNPDQGSIGSFHVSDMQSTTKMTIAEHE